MQLRQEDLTRLSKLVSVAGEILDPGEELPREPKIILHANGYDAVATWDTEGFVVVSLNYLDKQPEPASEGS